MDRPDYKVLNRLFAREADSNKYDFGHVLVIGGVPGMVGAPYLAARAALRSGAGLVTIAATANVVNKLEREVEEIMTYRLPADNRQAAQQLQAFTTKRKVNALAIGPGLDGSRAAMVQQLLQTTGLPAVLDAGGLRPYNGNLEALQSVGRCHHSLILSPHSGEFQRLVTQPLPGSREALEKLVINTAAATGATIILKGDRSFVANAQGAVYRNSTGNPGLATAGTGDVLTGLLGSLLAQGYEAFEAASAAVYLHGLAGDLAVQATTEPGLIASDVIEYIPAALQQIKSTM